MSFHLLRHTLVRMSMPYQYRPLSEGQIRVLHLQASDGMSSSIRVELEEILLSPSSSEIDSRGTPDHSVIPKYEALSYVMG